MPAVVLKAVSRRSVGQDLGRTSTVISLDISSHCKRNRKCMSHSKRLLVVDVVVVFCFFLFILHSDYSDFLLRVFYTF